MTTKTIGNPLSWISARLVDAEHHAEAIAEHVSGEDMAEPRARAIGITDLRAALAAGIEDFRELRTDVIFICLLYPLIGMVLIYAAFDSDLVPILGPIISGFALVGPVAGVGMYEMSRRRAAGHPASWYHALGVLRSPAFGAIVALSAILGGVLLVWLGAATLIYSLTMGPQPPASIMAFLSDMLNTSAGWTMMVVGIAVGFVFALAVLVASLVSFPLLLDRNVGLVMAVATSIRVAQKNPVTVLVWGAIVAGLLVLASIPAFLGMIFVMPILGHATWHLYKRAVE